MAKKIKPNRLFEDTPSEEFTVENSAGTPVVEADKNPVVGNGRMSAADVEKLEKYDAMEKSLAALAEEKAELESKVAEYIEKLESASSSDAAIAKLESEKAELEKKCKDFEESYAKVGKLERENASLREENDKYLMKISELTFDNANLTCQLSELEKSIKSGGKAPNQSQFGPASGMQGYSQGGLAQPGRDAYNPYINNGYGTW